MADAQEKETDIVVPRDFPTIQQAVDAAGDGDTIQVRRGTYEEEVVIDDKELTIEGEDATISPAKATIDRPPASPTAKATAITGARVGQALLATS